MPIPNAEAPTGHRGDLAALEAGENSSAQVESRDNTSPAEFVKAMAGHEKLGGSVKTVFVVVEPTVVIFVIVTVVVTVMYGMQLPCLGLSSAVCVAMMAPSARPPGPTVVLGGGKYESTQSVSSCNVAFCEFVTVKGGQLNSVASSGSEA